ITLTYSFFNITAALICTSLFFIGAGLVVILNKFLMDTILKEAQE
ncbi:MFS transporter, partial [Acinetobacter baumannii]